MAAEVSAAKSFGKESQIYIPIYGNAGIDSGIVDFTAAGVGFLGLLGTVAAASTGVPLAAGVTALTLGVSFIAVVVNPSVQTTAGDIAREVSDYLNNKVNEGVIPAQTVPSWMTDVLPPLDWFKPIHEALSKSLGTTPDPLVKTIRYVDPLTLDLDGDGLEITALSRGILFDANGDTIKTNTAWIGVDDGILVWDRNGNGLIDSGAELFGDETGLANGQKAANGFAALSELDTGPTNGNGAGDGVFDARDARYAELRVWRDLNQDAISQANELSTLADAGVQGIRLDNTVASTKNYGDAILAQSGEFTRADGTSGQAGSFILAQNNFIRSFTPIAVSEAAQALPGITGSGWVRDLQEAATQSPELIVAFNQAKDASTRADYKAGVANLLLEWGNDSEYASAGKQAMAAGYGLILSDPADDQERGWMDVAIKATDADRNAHRATLSEADLAKFDAMRERMVGGLEKIYAYEAFTAYTFLKWQRIESDAFNYHPATSAGNGRPVEVWVPFSRIMSEARNAFPSTQDGYILVNIPVPPSGMPHVDTLWNRLVDDATTNLMPALRLSKYIDMVDLNIDAQNGVSFDFSRLNAGLAAFNTTSPQENAALLIDFYRSYGAMLDNSGWDGAERIRTLVQQAVGNVDLRSAFAETGYGFFAAGTGATLGTDASDAFAGDDAANSFDTGAGDDQLFGGFGNNTYLFGRGDGQDTVRPNYDSAAAKLNTLEFKAGVATTDVTLNAQAQLRP